MYKRQFIDCPPIDIVADAQIIEKLADRTIFVVRSGLLDRGMLPELENIYQEKRFRNLSVILNGTEDVYKRQAVPRSVAGVPAVVSLCLP